MPAHRKPTEVLLLNGAFKHDPKRARPIGPKADAPLGDPPPYFTETERACWLEAVGNAPAGVLTSADRFIVEIAARLIAKFRTEWLTGPEMAQLTRALARMGWTPADRSRVSAAPERQEPSVWDEFR
jgi:hypothetical protein